MSRLSTGTARAIPSRAARIRNALAVAPSDGVLSGWAAAALWGVPESFLDGTADGTQTLPVEFSVPRAEGTFTRQGLRLRHSKVPPEDLVDVAGVSITSPRRTAFDLARWSRTEAHALAMVDLSLRHGLIGQGDFTAYVASLKRLHGVPRVRAVVPEMSDRAESVPESELRWLWLGLGLGRPQVNVPVHDRFGSFVARIDLLDPETGMGAEYQGYWHRLDGAPEQDLARFRRFAAMNLSVVAVWKEHMRDMSAGALLQREWRRAQQRDRRLDAWRCPGTGQDPYQRSG